MRRFGRVTGAARYALIALVTLPLTAVPSAAAAQTSTAATTAVVAPTYAYASASVSHGSQSRLLADIASSAARSSTNTSPALSTGDLSASQLNFVAAEGAAVGASRESAVADLTGGRVLGEPGAPGMKIVQPGVGSTDVDVFGPNGEYIAVGGPAKAANLAKLGQKQNILKYAAGEAGVPGQAYFARGTPQSAIDLANKILGDDNVFTFGP